MKLNGTHNLIVYDDDDDDDVNILAGSINTMKKSSEALGVTGKEMGVEVNTDKTKHMVMSQDQNVGKNRYIKRGIKSFETVEQSKCLETTLTYQNSIHEEINRRLMQGITLFLRSYLLLVRSRSCH